MVIHLKSLYLKFINQNLIKYFRKNHIFLTSNHVTRKFKSTAFKMTHLSSGCTKKCKMSGLQKNDEENALLIRKESREYEKWKWSSSEPESVKK
jgi:hypothetical protein